MAVTTYPGYEIERFEDEGGKCIILRPKSSDHKAESPLGDGEDARQKERHEKHQEPEAVREA